MFLHRDQDMLKGFPIEMRGDGDASPVLADLAGNDTNQLIVANSDGWIHAYQYDPATGRRPTCPAGRCTPIRCRCTPASTRSAAEVSTAHYDPVLEAPAAGDLFGDGRMEIVADDLQGNVYAWDSTGKLVFHQTSNPNYSGAPLAGDPSWAAQRAGTRQRTEGGFVTSPVLANLDPGAGTRPGHHRRRRGPPRLRLASGRDGRQRLPGARRGSRQGRLGGPDEQPADLQRQRPCRPGQKRRPGQDRRHARGGPPRRPEQPAEHHRRDQRGVRRRARQRRRNQRLPHEHGIARRARRAAC